MKGIILAGGMGSRLFPLTKTTNKTLLPVYDQPMIYYPIQLMVEAGIKDILIVCGGNAVGDFLLLLGNGEAFGLQGINYRVQSEPKGIADALSLAEDWVDGDNVCVLLADNIFMDSIQQAVENFTSGAQIFLAPVSHPEHYGIAEVEEDGTVKSIVEKPIDSKSHLAVTGLYLYDNKVWDFIRTLEPSERGELEITDVNNHYLREGDLRSQKLRGWWVDCGEDFDGYLYACNKVQKWKQSSSPCQYLYANQYVQGEILQLERLVDNPNIKQMQFMKDFFIYRAHIDHIPVIPGTITGNIYYKGQVMLTFHINAKGEFVIPEGVTYSVSCPFKLIQESCCLNEKTGVVLFQWNQEIDNIEIAINYEYVAE